MLEEREICFKKVFMSFSQSSFLCSQINHFPTVFFSLLLDRPPLPFRGEVERRGIGPAPKLLYIIGSMNYGATRENIIIYLNYM